MVLRLPPLAYGLPQPPPQGEEERSHSAHLKRQFPTGFHRSLIPHRQRNERVFASQSLRFGWVSYYLGSGPWNSPPFPSKRHGGTPCSRAASVCRLGQTDPLEVSDTV